MTQIAECLRGARERRAYRPRAPWDELAAALTYEARAALDAPEISKRCAHYLFVAARLCRSRAMRILYHERSAQR